MQPEVVFGAVGALLFLGSAYSFFLTFLRLHEGRIKDLIFLQGLLSLFLFGVSAFFMVLEFGVYPLLVFDLSVLFIFAFWSVVAHLMLAFSRSFGFKNTSYFKKVLLERNIAEFFGRRGYATRVPAARLLDDQLITPSGALSEGVSLERMEETGHVCRLPGPYAAKRARPAKPRRRRAGR